MGFKMGAIRTRKTGIVWVSLLIGLMAMSCSSKEDIIGGSGLLEADEMVLSAETNGQIEKLFFDEGTEVSVGDTLMEIDHSRLDLELEAALAGKNAVEAKLKTVRLQFEQAQENKRFLEKERDRVASLVGSGTATQKQLDQIEHEYTMAALGYRTAQAQITAAKAELAKIEADINKVRRLLQNCYPVAPISGTVTERYVDKGELAVMGKPLARISQLDTLWVKIYLPTGDFAQVKVGDAATVDTEAGEKTYRGTVVWTAEEAEFTPKNVQTKKSRANLVYAVKVRVPNTDGQLKIGMPVFVTIEK